MPTKPSEKKSTFAGFIRSITSPFKRLWAWISGKIKGLINKDKSGENQQHQTDDSVKAPSVASFFSPPAKKQSTSNENEESDAYREAVKLSRELYDFTKRLKYGGDLYYHPFNSKDAVEVSQIQEKANDLAYKYQGSTIYQSRHNDKYAQEECRKISLEFKPLVDRLKELTQLAPSPNSTPSPR